MLLLAQNVSALTGYLETFNDLNDSGSTVVAEPTAWYTNSPNSHYTLQHGGYGISCTDPNLITGGCSATEDTTFSLATPAAGQAWDLNYTATIHRQSASVAGGSNILFLYSPALHSGYSLSWASTTTVTFGRIFCSNVVLNVGSQLTVSTSVKMHYDGAGTITITDSQGSCSYSGSGIAPVPNVSAIQFEAQGMTHNGAGENRDYIEIDNLVWNAGVGTYNNPVVPLAPAGLSAQVVMAGTNGVSSTSHVDLRWPLSSNDPNQGTGDFTYEIFENGVSLGLDAVTTQDGEGFRFHEISITGTQFKTNAYWIVAHSGAGDSPPSCTTSVDDSKLGDFNACGSTTGLGAGGAITFTTPTDTAAGLRGFCSSLMGDSDGSLFLCGLILAGFVFMSVVAAFGAFSGNMSGPALIAGGIFGLGEIIFNVIAGIWSLGAFVIMAVLATGIILFFLRKMFGFGGASSNQDGDGGSG